MRLLTCAAVVTVILISGCSETQQDDDAGNPINIAVAAAQILSSDYFKGREAGREGGQRAADEIVRLIGNYSNFEPVRMNFAFSPERENENRVGTNIILTIPGKTKKSKSVLVATAHYDHLGEVGLDIFNGADDNASGVGGLFAIMQQFERKRPANTVVLVFLDAEEFKLQGAKAFVRDYKPLKDKNLVNLNLDMIAQSQKGELYMAGAHHTPALKPIVKKAVKGIGLTLKFGHDRPEDGDNDWTSESDHGVFHAAGIPFVYLGVEDHEHYHKATDSFETLPIEFYKKSLKAAVSIARALDKNLAKIAWSAPAVNVCVLC